MKHSLKITLLLLAMFLTAQLVGLAVNEFYSPRTISVLNSSGEIVNVTSYNMPYDFEPPVQEPGFNFISVLISFVIGIGLIFIIMKLHAETILRWWFFIVIILGIAISLTAFLQYLPYASWIALVLAVLLAYFKVFRRDMLVHNFTELIVYAGISAIFIPLFNVMFFSFLMVIISVYDIYAVWHSGFMQKMANYQMRKVKVFGGFFIPYIGKKERALIEKARNSRSKKLSKKIKVHVAILGGGDIVFPMIFSGIVLHALGFIPALLISLGAVLGLGYLFYNSEKGRFYPAMPFISIGCFIALALIYLFF